HISRMTRSGKAAPETDPVTMPSGNEHPEAHAHHSLADPGGYVRWIVDAQVHPRQAGRGHHRHRHRHGRRSPADGGEQVADAAPPDRGRKGMSAREAETGEMQ